jgi:glycosyltransferase involved in cell wall biosynthesis
MAASQTATARLIVDFTLDGHPSPRPEDTYLAFHEVAAAARSPRTLHRLLRGRGYAAVESIELRRPSNTVRGVVGVLLGFARTSEFTLRVEGQAPRRLGRVRYLARALLRLLVAAPPELAWTAYMAIAARRAGARAYALPRSLSRPGRVLYVRVDASLKWMGSYVGGAATHTTGVINGFLRNGLAVDVLASDTPQGVPGAAVTEVPARWQDDLIWPATGTDYSRSLVRAGRDRRFDFVYQRYMLGSFAGLELARRHQVPLVLEFNGSDLWVMRHWGGGRVRFEGTLAALEQRNLTDASLVVVVSEVLKEQVVEMGIPADRILVNPNGVDIDELAPYRERTAEEWRGRGDLVQAPTVGFIGTFGAWHGVEVLPEMVERVNAELPETRWLLIGDGHLREKVAAELASRGCSEAVTLSGVLDHDRALRLLAASDVCVSPHLPNPDGSRFFGSPTKLFEYMGLAKPIVASDLDQIGEVIDHERTGLLCEPGDVECAADAVLRLLRDEGLRARLGEAAFEEARRHYTWDAHTRRILDALGAGVDSRTVSRACAG